VHAARKRQRVGEVCGHRHEKEPAEVALEPCEACAARLEEPGPVRREAEREGAHGKRAVKEEEEGQRQPPVADALAHRVRHAAEVAGGPVGREIGLGHRKRRPEKRIGRRREQDHRNRYAQERPGRHPAHRPEDQPEDRVKDKDVAVEDEDGVREADEEKPGQTAQVDRARADPAPGRGVELDAEAPAEQEREEDEELPLQQKFGGGGRHPVGGSRRRLGQRVERQGEVGQIDEADAAARDLHARLSACLRAGARSALWICYDPRGSALRLLAAHDGLSGMVLWGLPAIGRDEAEAHLRHLVALECPRAPIG
jgi:hypothetical protein